MTKRFENNTVCNRSVFDDFRCDAIKNCTVQTIEYSQNRWIKMDKDTTSGVSAGFPVSSNVATRK